MDYTHINKDALDCLCRLAEKYANAASCEERFEIDDAAYEFLVYCSFSGRQMERFIDNYRRLRIENVH
jgi:hypothetical protein